MMMDQAHFGEYLLRQQMLHAASLSGLQHRMGADAEPPACEARLLNGDLWRRFHDIGTEMIITKGGRRMFPSLRVSLSGLDPREEYCVLLELSLVGRRRWRWAGGAWAAAGGAEPQSPRRLMLHPDSPAPGHHWTANPVSFSKLKLTNNTMDSQGHMVLTSMHKYRPRVLVVRARDAAALAWGAPHAAFSFPETEFIAVTAYQNDRITKLKIDNNPFAKGFRACGQSKCKRKSVDVTTDGETSAEPSEPKRPCSDAASSCSEEGSLRSTSPRSPPLVESPAPLVAAPENLSPPPSFYPPDLPYLGPLHMPMPLGLWPGNPMPVGLSWGPALPPPRAPTPPPAVPAPCRRIKSFTISALLGEG
ncbi:T-box transcription factor mls-1-like [Pectinophora gossypiella]|uniref:T-box transcription factor mls-1-like n=1 Tax=Pectinophora gossypiella TaxID=13191 RepID=UPI00214ED4BF|nr:T-box transcription factor mls-1-like [Pectinophora gossypiella]